MSPSPLKKLTVAHLRGSVASFELPFERGKNLTILYGENGTGKSTICDALELLSTGKVGSLDNRGLGKTNKYWNTVSKTLADVAVTLETADATCHARLVKGEVVAHPPDARPRVEVLRRGQILALLEARAAERYAAISRFIDVSGVETSENTLRKLLTDLNASRDIAVARIGENQETIQQFWDAAGQPGAHALAWATVEAARDPQAADPELLALRTLQAAYNRLAEYPALLPATERAVQLARESAVAAQQQVDHSFQQVARDAGDLVRVLEAAQTYLHAHADAVICPVCESGAAMTGLSARLADRLGAFTSFQSAQAAKKNIDNQVQRAEQQRDSLHERAQQAVAAFEQAKAQFAWSADIALPATAAPQEIAALGDWLATNADVPAHWNQAEAARQDQRQFLATLRSALHTYTENMQGQHDLDILLPNLQLALKIVQEERKSFSDTILRKIADEVGRMYEAVHPGEGLNKISLELDATRRASLDIGTSFAGRTGTPPQAYFSQSHLDTLGICVFLALATLDDPTNTILVLDDVLASVDEPHIDRLIMMLYDEVAQFRHCLITTHYKPWKIKYKWGWLQNKQYQFVELSSWSQTGGITTIRSMPDVDRLRLLLAESPPDLQLVCAKAGVVLEAALDFLTQLYECSMPRRPDARYTIGDLEPAIDKKLRQALHVDVLAGTDATGARVYQRFNLQPILDDLHRIFHVRNVFGCHFNALAFDLLDTDALLFGQKVLELIEILADAEAGWPRNQKSGAYWANAGETRRLYPLKRPS